MSTSQRNLALDGLRGLAVMAVVGYHFFPENLRGGYLGVDVFFVLSGYLITAGLLRSWQTDRQLHLRRFWVRRLRRLVPALVAMLLGTLVLLVVIGGDAGTGLRGQLLGALSYSSNWLQIGAGQSYFDQAAPPVFQHLWSLAVEEQFYILWPVLLGGFLLAATRLARPFTAQNRWIGASLVVVLAAASGALMAHGFVNGSDPSREYFGTDTHSFGLLLGACAAIVPQEWLARFGGQTIMLVRAVCLAGILAAVALLPDTGSLAYQGGIFAASLATAVLVAALETRPAPERSLNLRRVLEWDALQWVGRRSYGIYLWHWPLLVVGRQLLGQGTPVATALLFIPLTVLMAAISYKWVETPICRQGFGVIGTNWQRLRRRKFLGRPAASYAVALAMVGVLVVAGTAVVASPKETALQAQIRAGTEALAAAQAAAPPQQKPENPLSSPTPKPESEALPAQGFEPAKGDGSDVTAIGDSVMLASAQSLVAALPLTDIHAQVGYQTWDALGLLAKLREQGALRKNVLIGLGANGDFSLETLASILSELGADHQLTLVTTHGNRPWIPAANDHMRRFATTHPNVRLLDWDSLSAKVPDFAADGIHPGPEGARMYAQLVADGLAR
ncbi:acyltransferase family protein [Arthrobacter sp. TMN-49]